MPKAEQKPDKAAAYRSLVLAAIKELTHQGLHPKLQSELAKRLEDIDK